MAAEFEERDAQRAVDTMVPHAYVNHVPTMTGAKGREAICHFYANSLIPSMTENCVITPVDRSIGADSVVDEMVLEFVHDHAMDWMLPGVAPTGRHVRVPLVAVVKFEGDKVLSERIYWDQATVLLQLGLLPDDGSLPVAGAEQAAKQLDVQGLPFNTLLQRGTLQ